MHAGALRKLLCVFCICAGDNPLSKAGGLSSCIDANTIHCIMSLANFLSSMLFINFDKTLSFKGENLQTVFFFCLDLEVIEDIQ